jgi:hypothetical protein
MTAESSVVDVEFMRTHLLRTHVRRVVRRPRAVLYVAFSVPFALLFVVNPVAEPQHSVAALVMRAIACGVFAAFAGVAIRLINRAAIAKISAAASGTDDQVTAMYRRLLDGDILRARLIIAGLPLFGLLVYAGYIHDQQRTAALAYPVVAVVVVGLVLAIARLQRLTGQRVRMFRDARAALGLTSELTRTASEL